MLDYEGRKTIERNQFRLLHYAGEVTYSINGTVCIPRGYHILQMIILLGFVDKNNNLLYRSLKEAANTSRDPIILEMFPESELLSQKRPPTVSKDIDQRTVANDMQCFIMP